MYVAKMVGINRTKFLAGTEMTRSTEAIICKITDEEEKDN